MSLSTKLPYDLHQTQWAQQINPVIDAPQNNSMILKNQKLVSGNNVINHLLGQKLQGWKVVRKRQWLSSGTPTSYDVTDTQDSNNTPTLTLNLYCTQGTTANPVLVDIEVF